MKTIEKATKEKQESTKEKQANDEVKVAKNAHVAKQMNSKAKQKKHDVEAPIQKLLAYCDLNENDLQTNQSFKDLNLRPKISLRKSFDEDNRVDVYWFPVTNGKTGGKPLRSKKDLENYFKRNNIIYTTDFL